MLGEKDRNQTRIITYGDIGEFLKAHEQTITKDLERLLKPATTDDRDLFTQHIIFKTALYAVASKLLDQFKKEYPNVPYDSIAANGGEQTHQEIIYHLIESFVENDYANR